MTFGGTVLIIALCVVVLLAFVVVKLLDDIGMAKAKIRALASERDLYRAELDRAEMLMKRSAEINKGANDEKKKLDGPDAFAQSLDLLSKRTGSGR